MTLSELVEQRLIAAIRLAAQVTDYSEEDVGRLDNSHELAKLLARVEKPHAEGCKITLGKWEEVFSGQSGIGKNLITKWENDLDLRGKLGILTHQKLEEPKEEEAVAVEATCPPSPRKETSGSENRPGDLPQVSRFDIAVKVVTVRIWTSKDAQTIVEVPLARKTEEVESLPNGDVRVELIFSGE